jgi:hypothetical protein
MMMKRVLSLAAGVALSSMSLLVVAENATHVPGYTIHHNAMTTDTLSPQVAKAYNIQRSKNRGMLNVSVIKEKEGTTGTPVKARINASASNLTGQSRIIDLREVMDAGAIYYLADFRVTNQETLDFKLEVQPEGASTSYPASLRQQFFTE